MFSQQTFELKTPSYSAVHVLEEKNISPNIQNNIFIFISHFFITVIMCCINVEFKKAT